MKQGKNRFFFAPRDGVAGLSLVGASKSLSAFFFPVVDAAITI